jgi:hypothetical protein
MMDWIEDMRSRYCADLLVGFFYGGMHGDGGCLLDIARVKKAVWKFIHVYLLALAKSLYSYSYSQLSIFSVLLPSPSSL